MTCSHCGAPITEADVICQYCGCGNPNYDGNNKVEIEPVEVDQTTYVPNYYVPNYYSRKRL